MSKKQVKKSYSAPACMIIQVNEATYLMETSFPSQHKKAGHATGPAAAKSAGLWNDEDLEDEQQGLENDSLSFTGKTKGTAAKRLFPVDQPKESSLWLERLSTAMGRKWGDNFVLVAV